MPALLTSEAICLHARPMEEMTTASSFVILPSFSSCGD